MSALILPPGTPVGAFSEPRGEPAIHAPDSVAWQLFKNPVTLFIGGIAAVILELAEPRVRTGVWTYTSFRTRPVERLQRTGLAAMMTVYGARSRAEAMIASVVRRHERVAGMTPDGQVYRASDPVLLQWVHATACFGIVEATHAYARPLQREERDRFYAEGRAAARLYGASASPGSQAEMDALVLAMHEQLVPSGIVFEFLRILRHAPVLPSLVRPLQGVFIRAAVEITPPWIRTRLGIDRRWRLQAGQRRAVTALAQVADRVLVRSGPAVQACRRLGLPDDYVYSTLRAAPECAQDADGPDRTASARG